MKANEFVKKFGWEYSKKCLEFCGEMVMLESSKSTIMVASSDLKRLVESYELVESYGGLEKAKFEYQKEVMSDFGVVSDTAFSIIQAIADVESCL